MKFKTAIVGVAAVAASVLAAPGFAAYPEKPVTVICPWTAGGGTDVLLRALSKEAEKYLGQTINVVNQTGGAGAIGHNAIRAARPDGYTIGPATAEATTFYWSNTAPFTYEKLTPIALVNSRYFSPSGPSA